MSDSTSTKLSVFDFLNDICQGKKDVLTAENEKDYNPFFINRWLSMRIDTIMYAQEMNKCSHLPKRMQYDFYLYSIKKQRRKFEYIKHQRQDDIDLIGEYYQVNETRSKELLPLLSEDDIAYIKRRLYKGGKS